MESGNMREPVILERREGESQEQYIVRLCKNKESLGITWNMVAEQVLMNCGIRHDESYYRKYIPKMSRVEEDEDIDSVSDILDDLTDEQKILAEKVRLSDERRQINALIRRLSRENTLKEIALEYADKMSALKMLPQRDKMMFHDYSDGEHKAILQISDWHYGAVINSVWNVYNTDIAKMRVGLLRDKVIEKCRKNNVEQLHVVNLSDMIQGRIHLPLRINNQVDAITQVMEVSELLAEFLSDLSEEFEVVYHDCLDNHSRVEPNKNDSLDLESFARIITWYLKERLKDNKRVIICPNEYDDDIISFTVMGYNVCGVHGHRDSPSSVAENLTMLLKNRFDLVLTAHRHHFHADEPNEVIVLSNGSLMGTDEHAKNLRKSSKPSQNLIIVSESSVVDDICRIVLC